MPRSTAPRCLLPLLLIALCPMAARGQILSSLLTFETDIPPHQIVAVGDVDGDGRFEVARLIYDVPRDRQVLEISCLDPVSGGLHWIQTLDWAGGPTAPSRLRAVSNFGDLNGDGYLDLVSQPVPVTGSTQHVLVAFLGGPGGQFSAPQEWARFPYSTFMGAPRRPAILDVDGDGLADAVPGFRDLAGTLIVGRNRGGSFDFSTATYGALRGIVTHRVVGDFDGDGLEDLADRREEYLQTPGLFPRQFSTLNWRRGDGLGGLEPDRELFRSELDQVGMIGEVSPGDLDGDGRKDLSFTAHLGGGALAGDHLVAFYGQAQAQLDGRLLASYPRGEVRGPILATDVDEDGRAGVLLARGQVGGVATNLQWERPAISRIGTPGLSIWTGAGGALLRLIDCDDRSGRAHVIAIETGPATGSYRMHLLRSEARFVPACGAGDVSLGFDGAWLGQGTITLTAKGMVPGGPALLAAGLAIQSRPICEPWVLTDPGVALPGQPFRQGADGQGEAAFPFAVQPVLGLSGVPVYFRAATVDASGQLLLSAGVTIVLH